MSGEPLIITAALVGAEVMREQTPYIPYTPIEIAEEAARCGAAGAAMAHVHGRESDGRPTQAKEVYAAIVRETRARCDLLIQFSTGGAVGMELEERIEALALRPDMATLTTGTVNFGDEIFANPIGVVRAIASRLAELAIRPEIEIFDTGMIDTALRLEREGVLRGPLHFDFVLGVPGGMGGRRDALDYLLTMIPPKSTWSVAGVGRHELPLAEYAIGLGGHVRVGLEDNIYLAKGVLARGSWELVEAVAAMAERASRPLATPSEAARILRIGSRA